jgi:hypothetical protein
MKPTTYLLAIQIFMMNHCAELHRKESHEYLNILLGGLTQFFKKLWISYL